MRESRYALWSALALALLSLLLSVVPPAKTSTRPWERRSYGSDARLMVAAARSATSSAPRAPSPPCDTQ